MEFTCRKQEELSGKEQLKFIPAQLRGVEFPFFSRKTHFFEVVSLDGPNLPSANVPPSDGALKM